MSKITSSRPHEEKKVQKLIEKIKIKREARRTLRILKWIGTTPSTAVCTNCAKEFRIQPGTMTLATEAQQRLESEFKTHSCR